MFVVRQKRYFPEDIALWVVSGSAHNLCHQNLMFCKTTVHNTELTNSFAIHYRVNFQHGNNMKGHCGTPKQEQSRGAFQQTYNFSQSRCKLSLGLALAIGQVFLNQNFHSFCSTAFMEIHTQQSLYFSATKFLRCSFHY